MSTLGQFGFGSEIKSIQRGVITLPNPIVNGSTNTTQTATISPVNTSKSILFELGQQNGFSSRASFVYSIAVLASLELTNSTTITATIGYNFGNNDSRSPSLRNLTVAPKISWQLVEYY